ncbi:MAG: hypothetical protein J6C37_02830 [Roseburia sp.]|nr:hypothetical protein [Roseburia sp.]
MYKISVPIMNQNIVRAGRDRLVERLEKMNVQRVFLALDAYIIDDKEREKSLQDLRENCLFLNKEVLRLGRGYGHL